MSKFKHDVVLTCGKYLFIAVYPCVSINITNVNTKYHCVSRVSSINKSADYILTRYPSKKIVASSMVLGVSQLTSTKCKLGIGENNAYFVLGTF